MKNWTVYSKTIIVLHLITLLSLTMFFWSGWQIKINPFMNLGLLREAVSVFGVMGVYLLWFRQLLPLPKIYLFLFSVSFVSMLYGAGMHQAANQIADNVSSPSVAFYDEYFSHWWAWGSVLVINFLFGLTGITQKLKDSEVWFIGISGVVQGLVSGLNILEARFGLLALLVSIGFLVLLVPRKGVGRKPLLLYFKNYFVALVGFILFWVIMNGFIEPSLIL